MLQIFVTPHFALALLLPRSSRNPRFNVTGCLTSVNLNRLCLFFVAALFLAGCAADQVGLESRAISVDQQAEPAGAAGEEAAASVAHLLPGTGPTYVTLTVSQITGEDTGKFQASNTSAITSGSGFVVGEDGLVMTAAHVAVSKGNQISARAANGRVYSGTVIGINPANDMAVVKLRGSDPPAAIAST